MSSRHFSAFAALLTCALLGSTPGSAFAQQMNFSYYGDSWADAPNLTTLYTVDQGFDNSTGCTHYGYETYATLDGPTGSYSQQVSSLYSFFAVPLAEGTYTGTNDFSVNCSCFGSGLSAGSDPVTIFTQWKLTGYQNCHPIGDSCRCEQTACLPLTSPSCQNGWFGEMAPYNVCTPYVWTFWMKLTYLPIGSLDCFIGVGFEAEGPAPCS
jgi:hypothetical protein